MERIVELTPAYDKRDPNPGKNYDVHGVNLRMVLKGKRGAVHFLLYTDWHLPSVRDWLEAKGYHNDPLPADVGYHSPVPMYEGQEPISEACEYLDGKPCYYDGSGLAAEDMFDTLTREGDAGVWRELEAYYERTFGALSEEADDGQAQA